MLSPVTSVLSSPMTFTMFLQMSVRSPSPCG